MIEIQPIDTYYDLDARPMLALRLSPQHAANLVRHGSNLAIEVKGWKMLWPLGIEGGVLRAQCPTSPTVRPNVTIATVKGAE